MTLLRSKGSFAGQAPDQNAPKSPAGARTAQVGGKPAVFRLTHPTPPERDIQASCAAALDALLLPPAFWFSAAIGAVKLSKQQAAALARAGVKRGLPDIFVITPIAHGSRVLGIELKTRTGRLSKTRIVRTKSGAPRILEGQEDVFLRLQAAGMVIEVARSVDDMLELLEAWQIPLRSHYR